MIEIEVKRLTTNLIDVSILCPDVDGEIKLGTMTEAERMTLINDLAGIIMELCKV